MVVKFNKMNEVATYLVDLESGPLSIPKVIKFTLKLVSKWDIASRSDFALPNGNNLKS